MLERLKRGTTSTTLRGLGSARRVVVSGAGIGRESDSYRNHVAGGWFPLKELMTLTPVTTKTPLLTEGECKGLPLSPSNRMLSLHSLTLKKEVIPMRLEQSIRESVFLLGEVHRTLSTHPYKDHDIDLFEDMLLEVEMQIDRLKLEAKTLADGTHPIMVQS